MMLAAFSAAQPATPGQAQPSWLFPVMMISVFAIFYFLVIAPQKKKQKKHMEEIQSLTAGKQVITVGGIVGTVMGFRKDERLGDLIELKIGGTTTIVITRSAVGRIVDSEKPEPK
jgi:preprotein translocase subunit YajC